MDNKRREGCGSFVSPHHLERHHSTFLKLRHSLLDRRCMGSSAENATPPC